MIVVIDNYDSFTYNIVQSLQRLSCQPVKVLGSKSTTVASLESLNPDFLVISPGPSNPSDAGISMEAIRHFAGRIPVLGVCLGHQAIGQAFGAKIVHAKNVCHGKVEQMELDGRGLFRLIGNKGTFTRYHSLVIDEATLPAEFEITARSSDGEIMGIRHKTMIIEGIQFHPESIASVQGDELFTSFLNYRRDNLPVSSILNTLISGKDLDEKTAELFMESLTEGVLDERVTAAILTAMASKGPAATEMAGCAAVLCRKKRKIPIEGSELAEIVGTGGDGKGSFNISSFSALTAAACGLTMAKHGNKAVSSKSGAADFFQALGIKIDTSPEKTAEIIRRTNFGFLMAPVYHSAMRFAAPVRATLGIKTIMNVIGPLSNPAGAKYQMLGVYSPSLLEPVGRAAKMLGAKRVMVITSKDGFDEISPCDETFVFQIDEDGKETHYSILPQDFGITGCSTEELAGGTGNDNAALAIELMEGRGRRSLREAIGLNAGAVLYIAKKVPTLRDGYTMAMNALMSGAVKEKLEQVRAASNE